MKKLLYRIWSDFLTKFGNVKIFKFPLFLVYDPDDYQVTGNKVLEIMELIKPGDIILRGYNNYLDGKFVPDELKFSHGGLYIGNNMIIHAIAEGVSQINIVEFCQCDRIAIFRPNKHKRHAIAKANEYLKNDTPYDFGFEKGVSALYCFELCGECYEKLNIARYEVKKFFGLVKKHNVFLAKSFFTSPDMKCIFHFNPKFNIDIVQK